MNPLNWIGPETTTALSLTLLHSLWQVGLAVGVLWCVERFWHKLPVDRNYTLHAGMLLLTLALLPMTFYWVQTTREVASAPVAPAESLTQLTPPPSAVVSAEFDLRPATQSPTEPAPEVNPTIAPPSEHGDAVPASNWWPFAAMWVAACYVLGVLVMLLRLMLGIRRTERIRRRATHIEPGPLASTFARLGRELGVSLGCVLATSRDVLVPTVVGVVIPTILLPASALTGLSASELEMILLHELAHVRRHDQWVNLVQRLAEVVLFFNPALWYLSRRIATLREYCCDELTCRQLSPGDTAAHVEYAATLLRVVELARPASPVPAELTALAATGRGPSELRRRVARLFGEPLAEPVRLSRSQGILLLAMTLVLVGAPLAQSRSDNESETDESKSEVELVEVDKTESAAEPPGPTLRGRITNTEGKPIDGVAVVLWSGLNYRMRGQETTSNGDGEYSVSPLSTGKPVAADDGSTELELEMHLSHPVYVPTDERAWRKLRVPVAPGTVETVDIQMTKGGTIRGVVLDATSGKPAGRLGLSIVNADTIGKGLSEKNLSYRLQTDTAGNFESVGLPTGDFIIQVTDERFQRRGLFPRLGQVRVKLGETTEVKLTTADDPSLQTQATVRDSTVADDPKPMAPDQARIAALEELVNSYTEVHDRIEALYKHGIRRNESLQQARLALEVAKGDLAYAKGDVRQAVEYYELAVAAADEGVQAIALAEDKSLVTLDVLLDAHRRRAEVKTTLNRIKEELAKEKPNDTTSASATPAQTVPIQCLDANEKPVAGAEVYVFQHEGGDNGKYRQFGPFTTDADGRATCGEAIFTSEDGHFDRFYYARVPGKLVGVGRSSNWKQWGTRNPEGKINLRPSRSVEGHVVVPEGFDPTAVVVRVVTLSMRTGPGIGDLQMFPRQPEFTGLGDALNEIFECVPDAEGKFEFNDVPIGGGFYLVTKAEGLAEGQWYTFDGDYTRLVQIPLAKEGRLSGTVTNEKGEPLPGIEVAVQINPTAGQRAGHLTTFRATSDDQGEYELTGLPEWDLVLRMNDPEKKFVFCPSAPLFVASGTEAKRDLTMEKPVEVRGRVVDPDGKPVEGATLSAIVMDAASSGVANATSAADGQFAMNLPSGSFTIYVNGLPPEFQYPDPSAFKKLDIEPGQQPVDGLELRVSPKDLTSELTELNGGTLEVMNDSQPLLDVMAQVHGYKPAEGKVLAHVASPFDAIRMEYYRQGHPAQAKIIPQGPGAMWFQWDGETLRNGGMSFGAGANPGYSLGSLLDDFLPTTRVSAPTAILTKNLEGDWVKKNGASRDQILAELQEILRDKFGMRVRLKVRNLESEVYVATGRYQFKPIGEPSNAPSNPSRIRSGDLVEVFANDRPTDPSVGGVGGSGELDKFLGMVGHWIGTPIVSEVGPPSQRHVSWRFHNTVGTTPEERRENHDAEIVLANITRQTGIEFKKDRRLIEVLFVEQDKEDVE